MKALNRNHVKKFLEIAGDELHVEWVIIGGTVLPLLGVEKRVTVDIDLAAKGRTTNKEHLKLMEIADRLGLPVEAINTAAEFFLKKIPDWEKNLKPLHKGEKSTFFRPNAYLFLLLKIGRLTESDCLDCIEMVTWAKKEGELPTKLQVKTLLKRLRSKESERHLAVSEQIQNLERLLVSLARPEVRLK